MPKARESDIDEGTTEAGESSTAVQLPGPEDGSATQSVEGASSGQQSFRIDSASSASSSHAAPDAPVGPALGSVLQARGEYRLVRRLGKGGFGSVFLADTLSAPTDDSDSSPGPVAIKVLGKTNDPRAKAALKRELAGMLAIDHDRIPKLHDWSTEGETAFAVLEYFAAGSLADAWAFVGRLDEGQTWRLLSDLLCALAAAHRASVLHLDVKPANVLLDGNGGYVLTDFGVSHMSRMSRGLMHQGHLSMGIGTQGYRAPEQESGRVQAFDLRTDLWGVGATAWAMVSGIDLNKRPDLLRHRQEGADFGLPLLSEVLPDCPPPLEEVIMGLLYVDPGRRPGGASEVLAQAQANVHGFGLDPSVIVSLRRNEITREEIRSVIESLMDPLWSSICRGPGFDRFFVKFNDGEVLSSSGTQSLHTILLLNGKVRVELDDELRDIEEREGVLLGAISTLTGAPREVTLRADGTVWACIFNEAEFEQLVTCNPSIAVRMIRSLATRLASGPSRHDDSLGK